MYSCRNECNLRNFYRVWCFAGTIEIATSELTRSNPVEKWYTLNSSSANKKASGEAVQLRVKARYQSVPILPVTMYQELVDFIEVQYKQLVESLEPVLSTKVKEDVSDSLVRVMIGLGHDVDFLTDITMAEVSKIGKCSLSCAGRVADTLQLVFVDLRLLVLKYSIRKSLLVKNFIQIFIVQRISI